MEYMPSWEDSLTSRNHAIEVREWAEEWLELYGFDTDEGFPPE